MLDHITLTVSDLARSKAFFAQALAPLGYGVLMEFEGACGLGVKGKPDLWLHQGDEPRHPMHVAFVAPDRAAVDAFHAAALPAGAEDNGGPGIRQDYHANYYAAFVLDPDGNNVEAVCHFEPARGKPARSRRAARPSAAARKGSARKAARKPARAGRKAPARRGTKRR